MPDSGEIFLEPLSEDNMPSDFRCNDKDLEEFLTDDALIHQDQKIAMTTLVFIEDEVVAYFSLCMDCISLHPEEKEILCPDFPYQEYPALKVARLAVRTEMQNQGIGRRILKYIIGYAQSLQDDIGVRFLSVDAYPQSAEFYKRFGFSHNLHREERKRTQTVSMRFDLEPLVSEEDEDLEDETAPNDKKIE